MGVRRVETERGARVRREVTFGSNGERCAAWLYPADASPAPIVVMAHGLSGTRRDRLGPFAERFSQAGIAALVFDHRGFGDSGGEPDLFDPSRQLEDWRAAIAYARELPGIDPARVATFGSSFGGGNALLAAAEDPAVAAAISQVPYLDRSQSFRASRRVIARMMLAAALGRHLPAVGQPGEPAFISAPHAEEGWRRVVAMGEDSRWRNRVSARWLLGRPYRASSAAAGLHCPWLVCVAGSDRVARPGVAIAAANRAPLGELRIYTGIDHFDIYDGPEHEAVAAAEVEFLRRHLLDGFAIRSRR